MAEPQKQVSPTSTRDLSAVELEWLVAQFADEGDYWKAQAEAFERVLDELRTELGELYRHAEIAEAWRRGLSSDLVDLANRTAEPPSQLPVRSMAVVLSLSLFLWSVLGLFAYGVYRLFAG